MHLLHGQIQSFVLVFYLLIFLHLVFVHIYIDFNILFLNFLFLHEWSETNIKNPLLGIWAYSILHVVQWTILHVTTQISIPNVERSRDQIKGLVTVSSWEELGPISPQSNSSNYLDKS